MSYQGLDHLLPLPKAEGHHPPQAGEELPLVLERGPLKPHDGPPEIEEGGGVAVTHCLGHLLALLSWEKAAGPPVPCRGAGAPSYPLVVDVLGEPLANPENKPVNRQ